jgi:hypothetical protein
MRRLGVDAREIAIQHVIHSSFRYGNTIPVSALDLDATIAANHERGIEVPIPRDRNTVFLGF